MKKAIVVHSGGMDSSICLALAIRQFTAETVLSLSFSYHQRHSTELESARLISQEWGVEHALIDLSVLSHLTRDAMTDKSVSIRWGEGHVSTTLTVGRNGLMARLAAIHAHQLGAGCIYMGVMEEEAIEVGYRDCSKEYIALKQQILRIDLGNPDFEIRTPLISLRKEQTMELAHNLRILPYLLEKTVSCYEGKPRIGCQQCPACFLRNRGLAQFKEANPEVVLPY